MLFMHSEASRFLSLLFFSILVWLGLLWSGPAQHSVVFVREGTDFFFFISRRWEKKSSAVFPFKTW